MRRLSPWADDGPLELLLVGAHPDDIEIGCGASVLRWVREGRVSRATWVVFSSTPEREAEARQSAAAFLGGVPDVTVRVQQFRDGYLPYQGEAIKDLFEEIKGSTSPDLVLTHDRDDRHQDHRLVGELTWQTFRDHLILEYEVPKFDGELSQPNTYVEVPDWAMHEKLRLLREHFPSQADRPWFSEPTFRGMARLRGVESRSSSGHAEAFRCRKIVFG